MFSYYLLDGLNQSKYGPIIEIIKTLITKNSNKYDFSVCFLDFLRFIFFEYRFLEFLWVSHN